MQLGYSLVSRGGVGVALAAAGNRSSKHVDKRQEGELGPARFASFGEDTCST